MTLTEKECLKALQCLYLEVDSTIADDVKKKVIAALDELKKQLQAEYPEQQQETKSNNCCKKAAIEFLEFYLGDYQRIPEIYSNEILWDKFKNQQK